MAHKFCVEVILLQKIMEKTKKLQNGVGATCSAMLRFLHPHKVVTEKYPNAHHKQRLGDLLVVKRETTKVNHVEKMCIFF